MIKPQHYRTARHSLLSAPTLLELQGRMSTAALLLDMARADAPTITDPLAALAAIGGTDAVDLYQCLTGQLIQAMLTEAPRLDPFGALVRRVVGEKAPSARVPTLPLAGVDTAAVRAWLQEREGMALAPVTRALIQALCDEVDAKAVAA